MYQLSNVNVRAMKTLKLSMLVNVPTKPNVLEAYSL